MRIEKRLVGMVVAGLLVMCGLIGNADAQWLPKFRAKNADGCVNGQCPLVKAAATVVTSPIQAVQNAREFRSNYASVGAQSGYGSYGSSVTGYGSGGSTAAGYGSVGTSYGVDYDGAPITSYGVTVASQPTTDATQLRIGDRSSFRKSLLAAGRKARDAGEITSLEFFMLSAASRNPATLDRMQAAVHEAAIEEGLATTQAIDWDSLIVFIEKLIPIIIKLIDLFGQVTLQTATQYASNTQCSTLDSFHIAA